MHNIIRVSVVLQHIRQALKLLHVPNQHVSCQIYCKELYR